MDGYSSMILQFPGAIEEVSGESVEGRRFIEEAYSRSVDVSEALWVLLENREVSESTVDGFIAAAQERASQWNENGVAASVVFFWNMNGTSSRQGNRRAILATGTDPVMFKLKWGGVK